MRFIVKGRPQGHDVNPVDGDRSVSVIGTTIHHLDLGWLRVIAEFIVECDDINVRSPRNDPDLDAVHSPGFRVRGFDPVRIDGCTDQLQAKSDSTGG